MLGTYRGGKILAEKGVLILTAPLNSWDMNYHLHDIISGEDFLIDIDSVTDDEDELEENGGILYSDLVALEDVDYIKEHIWKVI